MSDVIWAVYVCTGHKDHLATFSDEEKAEGHVQDTIAQSTLEWDKITCDTDSDYRAWMGGGSALDYICMQKTVLDEAAATRTYTDETRQCTTRQLVELIKANLDAIWYIERVDQPGWSDDYSLSWDTDRKEIEVHWYETDPDDPGWTLRSYEEFIEDYEEAIWKVVLKLERGTK